MEWIDPQFTKSDVLHAFNRSQVYLLLGSAISTLGLLSTAFLILRRRYDPLLFWFSVLAILYGVHLVLNYQLSWLLGFQPEAIRRFTIAIELLLPLPAVFFFRALDVFGRAGRLVTAIVWPITVCLSIAVLTTGIYFRSVNHVVQIVALVVLALALIFPGCRSLEKELIRRGLLLFIVFALYDNVTAVLGKFYYDIAPFSVVVLLACLALVAGRRALSQEHDLLTIQQELEIARRMQISILPHEFPTSASFRIASRYVPMTSVAGDFYDFLVTNDLSVGILVADVSGHGVPAALIASMVKLAAASQLANASVPSTLLSGMNAALLGNTQNQFVTAAYVFLNAETRELLYSAAAHPPMLLLRKGQVSQIIENGLMLAAFSFATYSTFSCPLLPGDRLLMYTDGVLEATNANDEEFGDKRLASLLQETASLSHIQATNCIVTTIENWAVSQSDDLTVLICDYHPDANLQIDSNELISRHQPGPLANS